MSGEYSTPVGNTVGDFEGFHDGAKGGNLITLEVTLDVASDIVEALAPRPAQEPWPDQYVRRAKNAELLVARWVFDTEGGQLSSTGLSGVSVSYQSNPAVREIVKSAMGSYAANAEQGVGGTGVARIGRLRL